MADFVRIIVPTLNEERHIAACLDSLLASADGIDHDILVVDGGSDDQTCQIVSRYGQQHAGIQLVHNPARLQSAALNLAAKLDAPPRTVLVRADAHAEYPPDFLARCLAALRQQAATSVVVPMITVGAGGMQRAIAAAQNSRFGNGGSAHRRLGVSRFVDHGHHALFDRDFFLRLGGYDASFSHNEDAEFDHRAVSSGGRIWMCVDAPVRYYPRSDLFALARQYVRHGKGRAQTYSLHRMRLKARQFAPVAILAALVCGLALLPLSPIFLIPFAAYVAICFGRGLAEAVRTRDVWLAAMGPAVITMHLGWACGFLAGLASWRHGRSAIPVAAACLLLLVAPARGDEFDATPGPLRQVVKACQAEAKALCPHVSDQTPRDEELCLKVQLTDLSPPCRSAVRAAVQSPASQP